MVFTILFFYGLSPDVEDSSLCYTAGLCCLSILNVIVASIDPKLPVNPSIAFLPSWQPQVCSLCLCVCFCFVWVHCALFYLPQMLFSGHVMSDSLRLRGLQRTRLLSLTRSQRSPRFMSIESVMPHIIDMIPHISDII